MTCSTCANWNLRSSREMAALHLAACALGPKWTYMPAHATCERWKALQPDQADKRAEWLRRSSSRSGACG